MTLEEAQAQIIDLQTQLEEQKTQNQTLSQDNAQLSEELGTVRALNQKYFNQLQQQFSGAEGENDNEEEAPSCQDYAKTLKF